MSLRDTWIAGRTQRQQEQIQRQQVVQQELSNISQARQTMATALRCELTEFHDNLQESVDSLRQNIKIDLDVLTVETQEFLATRYQQRMETKVQTQQELSGFMQNLRSQVWGNASRISGNRSQVPSSVPAKTVEDLPKIRVSKPRSTKLKVAAR
jgi:type II secretory pathway pseudopilin PulG